jgi:hypothetical protein
VVFFPSFHPWVVEEEVEGEADSLYKNLAIVFIVNYSMVVYQNYFFLPDTN